MSSKNVLPHTCETPLGVCKACEKSLCGECADTVHEACSIKGVQVPDFALHPVCDSCLTVAYDHGVYGLEDQEEFMRMLGADVEDHLCDEVETDGEIKCGCPCRAY